MPSHVSTNILRSLTLVVAAIFAVAAQSPPRTDFNRPQSFDIQHYIIRASFDRANKRVLGDTTITLKPIAAELRQVALDAVDIKIESVKLEPAGAELAHQSSRTGVVISLDRAYAP